MCSTVYADKSFDFVVKTPPAAVQLLESAKIKKGSAESNKIKIGSITWDQIKTILKINVTQIALQSNLQ